MRHIVIYVMSLIFHPILTPYCLQFLKFLGTITLDLRQTLTLFGYLRNNFDGFLNSARDFSVRLMHQVTVYVR